jgi:hypothetical protein
MLEQLNQFYARAMAYEFSLNSRDINFIERVTKVRVETFKIIKLYFILFNLY